MYNTFLSITNKYFQCMYSFKVWPATFGFLGYNYINLKLEQYQSKKLAMNSTSFFHAISSVIIGSFGNWKLTRINSGGYFLFDILYLLRYRKINTMCAVYLYHHMASLYYMSLSPLKFNWLSAITFGELSNIPSYIVYYYIQKRNDMKRILENSTCDRTNYSQNDKTYINIKPYDTRIKKWKRIQFASYAFLRLGVCSYLIYNELVNKNRNTDSSRDDCNEHSRFYNIQNIIDTERVRQLWPVIPIYVMGVAWSWILGKRIE